jgi:hypothetical protein
MQQVLQGFGIIYIEGHRRVLEITTDILNIVSNYCKSTVVVVFALTFPFTWFSLLILHVFKLFFGHFIQNKVLSLSVFKSDFMN